MSLAKMQIMAPTTGTNENEITAVMSYGKVSPLLSLVHFSLIGGNLHGCFACDLGTMTIIANVYLL